MLRGPVVTGMAHLLEHMAFKGTTRVGTRDYAAEAPLLEALDEGHNLSHLGDARVL